MTDQPPPPSGPPAGWYPDAEVPGHHRWWDGARWTDQRQAVQFAPPAAEPPPEPTSPPAAPSAMPPPPAASGGGYPPPMPTPAHPPSRNALATWSLVLGILGVLAFLVPFVGLGLGAIALTFGIIGFLKSRASAKGRGVAIGGIVLGAVATAIGLTLTILFMVTVGTGTRTSADSPASVAAPSESAEPAPSEPAPSAEPAEPAPSAPAADGMSVEEQAEFVLDSRNDLVDFGKDLDDMVVTIDEGGFWRLLSNSVELSFNHGQLAGRTAPPSIATEWSDQLAVLDDQITQIDDAIEDERHDDLRTIIAAAHAQLVVLDGILDKAAR